MAASGRNVRRSLPVATRSGKTVRPPAVYTLSVRPAISLPLADTFSTRNPLDNDYQRVFCFLASPFPAIAVAREKNHLHSSCRYGLIRLVVKPPVSALSSACRRGLSGWRHDDTASGVVLHFHALRFRLPPFLAPLGVAGEPAFSTPPR